MHQEKERAQRLRVREAIVGGGLQLKPGQIVEREKLGRHVEELVRQGALEPCTDWDEHEAA